MASTWTDRLAELGITLPDVVPPVASYTPAVRTGNLVYTSGQLPIVAGELSVRGKVSDGAEGVVRPRRPPRPRASARSTPWPR